MTKSVVGRTLSLCLLYSALFQALAYGQQNNRAEVNIPRIVSPSPIAAGFAKYGDVPVSTYTGTANISIPLYTVQEGDIKVPISLNYHTGGVKLNEQAGWVGLGWVLQGGGVISRTVRGRDDLINNHHFNNNAELVTKSSFNFIEYLDPQNNENTLRTRDGLSTFNLAGVNADITNFEYDVFTYSLPGRSGKFIINRKREAILEKNEDVKIELMPGTTPVFKVTDDNGLVYHFNAVEYTALDSEQKTYITAWYLSRIESPTGRMVSFEYEETSVQGTKILNEIETIEFGKHNVDPKLSNATYSNPKILKRIVFNKHRVEFNLGEGGPNCAGKRITGLQVYQSGKAAPHKEYVFEYGYFNESQANVNGCEYKRLKLSALYEKSGTQVLPPHRFYYHEETEKADFTSINSYSMDHWGYFNGADNHNRSVNLMPPYRGYASYTTKDEPGAAILHVYKDMAGADRTSNPAYMNRFSLKEIHYPTGGKTTLALEAHEYNSQLVDPVLELRDASQRVVINARGETTGTLDFSKAYGNVTMTVAFRCSASDECAVVKATARQESIYFEVNLNGSRTRVDLKRDAQELTCGNGTSVCTSKVYTFAASDFRKPAYKGFIDAIVGTDFQEITVAFQYKEPVGTQGTNPDEIAYAGGLRIREIVDYDEAGKVARSKKYDYRYQEDRNQDGVMENYSYGRRISPLQYFRQHLDYSCKCDTVPDYYAVISFVRYNSSVTSANTNVGASVGYSQVTEYVYDQSTGGTLGRTVYEYDNNLDVPGIYDFTLTGGSAVGGGLVVNNNRFPGIPSEQNRSNGTLRKKTDYVKTGPAYKVVSETENEYEYPLVNKYYSFKHQVTPPNGFTILQMYVALKQERHLLKKTTTRVYDQNLSGKYVTTVVQYGYGDKHGLPTEVVQKDSKGEEVISKTVYPPDYGTVTATGGGIKLLQDKHIVAVPVEQYTLSQVPGGTAPGVVGGTLTRFYDDRPLPKEVHLLETAAPIAQGAFRPSNQTSGNFAPDARYKPRLYYDQYDEKGNIMTVHKSNDVPLSYLWGYNRTYPIAEIKNASLSTTITLVSRDDVTVGGRIIDNTNKTGNFSGDSFTLTHAQNVAFNLKLSRLCGASDYLDSPFVSIALRKVAGEEVQLSKINFYATASGGEAFTVSGLPAGTYYFEYTANVILNAEAQCMSLLRLDLTASFKEQNTIPNLFHTSFEEDTQNVEGRGKTGQQSHKGPYSLTLPKQAGKYHLSYWTVPAGGDDWVLHEELLEITSSGPATRTIGTLGNLLDEVRVHPEGSFMTTYTYDPLIGMTSQTGPDGVTLTYAYDDLGRLVGVKDHLGNLVKHYEYHYKKP